MYSLRDLGEWTPKGEAKVRSANINKIAEAYRNDMSPQLIVE